jgi:hypothetical protein
MKQVTLRGKVLGVYTFEYANGNPGLMLTLDGSDYGKASVNIAETIPEGHVLIKDYSEGEGTLAALMEAGVVSAPVLHISSGYVELPMVRVLATE